MVQDDHPAGHRLTSASALNGFMSRLDGISSVTIRQCYYQMGCDCVTVCAGCHNFESEEILMCTLRACRSGISAMWFASYVCLECSKHGLRC